MYSHLFMQGDAELKLGMVVGGGHLFKVTSSRVMHGSAEVNQRYSSLEIPYPMVAKFGRMNPCPKCNELMESQGHAERGLSEVKLLRNVLWPPNLVDKNPDQSVIHYLNQRSCRGHLGSTRCQIA